MLVIAIILGLLLVLSAIPAILAYIVLSRIPEESRTQNPALAFLLLVPFFSVIWAFFVHPKVASSLRKHFEKIGSPQEDYGDKLALWFCIASACAFVPVLGAVGGIAALVLGILFYIKTFALSAKIAAG